MKNVYCISTKQHEDMKSDDMRSKNSTISQVLVHCLVGERRGQAIPTSVRKSSFWSFCCCCCNSKTSTVQQWTRRNPPSKQGSYSACLSTPATTRKFVLVAHYDVSITSWL